jgi:2-polyprenyl-3-methyl-5-hydroxy-6-metoxy-1,4-benzoquinol methylase
VFDVEYVGSELELFADARNWKRYWSQHVRPFIGGRVFDVGAGLGSNIEVLHRLGSEWLCIEPDPSLAKATLARIAKLGRMQDCQVFNGTLAEVPEDELADTIIYIDVLEHIEEHDDELRRASKHLRPGGHLIVLAPAYQALYSSFDTAVGHCRRYNRRSLTAVVPSALQLKLMRYLDSVGLFASVANKLLLHADNPTRSQIKVWDRLMVPTSRFMDKLVAYRAGKTILGVWRLPHDNFLSKDE